MNHPFLRSYPKVYNMGHRAIRELFLGPVMVQEKVDGSQFSFGVDDDNVLHVRSKRVPIRWEEDDIPALFRTATEWAVNNQHKLVPGRMYRGEAIQSLRHNTLTYARVPEAGFVLFDVDVGLEFRMSNDELQREADTLQIELVPMYEEVEIVDPESLLPLLQRPPMLGGEMIEGVVVKNQARFGIDGKMLMGKVVAQAFREQHKANSTFKPRKDFVVDLARHYQEGAEPRWLKAIQHLTEEGALEGTPKDIGALIREVQQDFEDECADAIKEELYGYFARTFRKHISYGLPEFYKAILMSRQFDQEEE